MLGCDMGTLFKVAVAGGSYQEGLLTHIQGVPPGLLITEEEISSGPCFLRFLSKIWAVG